MPATSRLALSPFVFLSFAQLSTGLTFLGAQKYHDALFAPVADPSPSTLAQAGLFVALRDLESSFSASPSTPWASISLAGFRVGGVDTFKRSIELTEPGEAGRTVQVSVGAPTGGAFDVEVVDFAGTTTSFPAAKPVSHVGDAVSISTLLGDHLSLVDVVSQAGKSAAGGEKLSLFNTGEAFVGEVEILPPSWLEELKGAGTVAVGSARAPMRTLRSFVHEYVDTDDGCTASRIVQVFVKPGETVTAGTPLVMVEAMKTVRLFRTRSQLLVLI